MRWLLPFFAPHRARLLRAQAIALSGSAASVAGSLCVAWALDRAIPAGDATGLTLAAVGYGAAVVLAGLLSWTARVRIEAIAQAGLRDVREAAFGRLLDMDAGFHDDHPPGRLAARLSGDTDALRTLLTEVVLQAPADAALVLGLLVVLTAVAPPLALVVAATVPVYAVAIFVFRRSAPPLFLRAREEASHSAGLFTELVRALPLARTYRRRDWLLARAESVAADKQDADTVAGLASVGFFNALFAVRALSLGILLLVGGYGVAAGTLTVGALLLALDYARKLFEPIIRLQFHILTIERARAGGARMRELLALEPRVRAPAQPAPWPGGALCLEDVGFGYRADAPVLHAVSLRVAPGERVAIVGPTGSGKSTIVSLLLRVRDPLTGRLTIGGVDARALDPAELRRRVGLVAQSLQLLPGTVAENLGVPPERAGHLLDALGLAERLRPETRVGDGGAPLSRGEVQLLCLARAIAEDPPFVLLDEATASMDPETEARAAQLLRVRPERAVLVVAHRLRTIVDAQRIYVLVAGRVVEVGDHPTLLARGGAYASLWRAQLAAEAA